MFRLLLPHPLVAKCTLRVKCTCGIDDGCWLNMSDVLQVQNTISAQEHTSRRPTDTARAMKLSPQSLHVLDDSRYDVLLSEAACTPSSNWAAPCCCADCGNWRAALNLSVCMAGCLARSNAKTAATSLQRNVKTCTNCAKKILALVVPAGFLVCSYTEPLSLRWCMSAVCCTTTLRFGSTTKVPARRAQKHYRRS